MKKRYVFLVVAIIGGHEMGAMNALGKKQRALAEAKGQIKEKAWKETFSKRIQDEAFFSLHFAPEENQILVSGENGVYLYDLNKNKKLRDITKQNYEAALSPDGKTIAVQLKKYEIGIVNAQDGRQEQPYKVASSIKKFAFSPDGKIAAAAFSDSTVGVYGVSEKSTMILGESRPEDLAAWSVAFAPGTDKIAVGYDATRVSEKETAPKVAQIKIFETATGAKLKTIDAHKDIIYTVAFSPDGALLLSTSQDRSAKIWNAQSGTLIHILEQGEKPIDAGGFSRHGKLVLTASRGGFLSIFDAASGTFIHGLSLGSELNAAAFSPSGTKIAVGMNDGTLKILSLND